MKKILSFFVICFLWASTLNAQNQDKKVKDGVLYLIFDGKNIEYFTSDQTADSKKSINGKMTFSLKNDNTCNIYLKWLNPLKYKLTWKDSTYIDERDKAVNDFINLLVSQFGTPVTSLNNEESKSLIAKSTPATLPANSTELYIPTNGFNNTELTLLYLQLRSNQNLLTDDERKNLTPITKSIEELDTKISTNILLEVDETFTELLDINDPSNVLNIVTEKEAKIKKYDDLYFKIEELQKSIIKSLSELALTDKLLNSYAKTIVSIFIDQTTTTTASNKNLTNKLKPIVEIVKNSLTDESSNTATKGFFRIRNIGFEDGKKIQASVTITELEYKKDTKEFSKKNDVLTQTLIFQKYDMFGISVSTGIFYGNTTLKGFGVANDGNNFTVTEDDINKNTPVAAVFLNFDFKTSRYFSPLLQVGIDPTKKRPFMLLGTGFSIPAARIAISGGPIWTWNSTLDKLSVGQTITSTTDLDKDIKYKFDVAPKGWYLGIQYKF